MNARNTHRPVDVNIYKGKEVLRRHSKKTPNVIVFDLDETLGSYADLNIMWENLKNNILFNDLVDLYPEFTRYGILSILDFIYQKKISGICDKIFIYTNNKCSYDFVELISKYFSYKLGIADNNLFDQIIRAFKVGNKIVEVSRTTQEKTHTDFIRCTLLPPKTQMCFIDNSYFPEMENKRIYYIQPLSYRHDLTKDEIINRLKKENQCKPSKIYSTVDEKFLNRLYDKLYAFPRGIFEKHREYFETKHEINKLVSQKIM